VKERYESAGGKRPHRALRGLVALLEDQGLWQQHPGHRHERHQQQHHLDARLAAEQEARLVDGPWGRGAVCVFVCLCMRAWCVVCVVWFVCVIKRVCVRVLVRVHGRLRVYVRN
jgi:hypothetical protein